MNMQSYNSGSTLDERKKSDLRIFTRNINETSVTSRQQLQYRTRKENTRKEQKETGNAIHGFIYQLKILMLFLHRGVALKYSFRLGTEIKEAKKFDDLVFEYTQEGKNFYRLLQAKHKMEDSKNIKANSLLLEPNGDYSLIKYFLSYQDAKKEELFKDGVIKDVTICTNIDFDFKNLEGSQIRVEKIEDEDDILNVKSNNKQAERYRFSKDVAPMLKDKLQQTKQAETVEFDDDDISDFLDHLVFAVNQPNEEELGEIIKKEIGEEFDFITTENVYNKFFITMLNWLQGKEKDRFLSYETGKEFFEEAIRGIPIWFGVRDSVESFTGRAEHLDNLHKILQGEDETVQSHVVSITGLGGIGKSELARKYINERSQEYDNKVVWINAESYQTLADSFRRLACDTLRISTENVDGKKKNISSIVEDVYRFFSNGKSLFVFDNAEKYRCQGQYDNGIDRFLPSLPPSCDRPFILITSRNQKWPSNMKMLPLDAFSEDESERFVKKSLNIENDAQKEDIKVLSRTLQFLPLALQQAVAYIKVQDVKMQNVRSNFNVCNYLDRYRAKTKELLNFEFPEDSDNIYAKTILVTWDVTLDAIRIKDSGIEALQILDFISYLAPDNIHVELLLSLISNEEKLGSAIELLKQYSMVNLGDGTINIHRLVQQVTRIKLNEQNEEKVILKTILVYFSEDAWSSENVDHAISIWDHSSKYIELVTEFPCLPMNISLELIHSVKFEEAYLFGSRATKLLSSLPSKNDRSVVYALSIINHNIALVLSIQGKYYTALKAFQEVYNKQRIIFGPDDPLTINTKDNIADVLHKQGRYNEALGCFQEVLSIRRKSLGERHPDTLLTQLRVADLLRIQGKYDEALQIFQIICNIQEITLGENHSHILITKSNIAVVLIEKGEYNKALQMLQKIYLMQKATFRENNPVIENTRIIIADTLIKQGKYNDAMQIYQEVLANENVVFGENHPALLRIQCHMANVLRGFGNLDMVLQIVQEVYDKQKGVLSSDHPDILNTEFLKALTLHDQGKYSDSLRICQEVLRKRKLIFGNDNLDNLKVRNCMALIFLNQGEYNRAIKHWKKILKIQKNILGSNHLDTLLTNLNIGSSLLEKREYDEALQIFQETLRTFRSLFPDNHPDMNTVKNKIGQVLVCQNKHDEALETFREVLDSQEAISGEEHLSTLEAKYYIAILLDAKGRHNEALELYREVSKRFNTVYGPEHQQTLKVDMVIQLLLSKIAKDLFTAVKKNNKEKVETLLKNSGDVNTRDNDGRSLLHYAINNGNINIMNILLENGADCYQITNKGNTPLHTATSKGYQEIVDVLLRKTSHEKLNNFINAQTTNSGTTSLHIAAENGFLEIVKSLLKHGATYNITNKGGKTPLDLTEDQQITNLLKLIDELFEDVKIGNAEGKTISKLEALARHEFLGVTSARNNQGNTLLQVAVINRHTSIANKLLAMLQKSKQN